MADGGPLTRSSSLRFHKASCSPAARSTQWLTRPGNNKIAGVETQWEQLHHHSHSSGKTGKEARRFKRLIFIRATHRRIYRRRNRHRHQLNNWTGCGRPSILTSVIWVISFSTHEPGRGSPHLFIWAYQHPIKTGCLLIILCGGRLTQMSRPITCELSRGDPSPYHRPHKHQLEHHPHLNKWKNGESHARGKSPTMY